MGLHRLPFFTQKVAGMLLGALVATLALPGGVATLVGPPGADEPDHLVPGSTPRPPAPTWPAPGQAGGQRGGDASAPAGGPASADPTQVPAGATASGQVPAGPAVRGGAGGATPAAPPTTTAPTTTGQGGLPPLDAVVSSVVSTLLPR
jgi:hypothetical protein